MNNSVLVGDIVERHASALKTPELPANCASSSTGFPLQKHRWKTTAPKQRQTVAPDTTTFSLLDTRNIAGVAQKPAREAAHGNELRPQKSIEEVERRRIDEENRQRIASMSPQEIAQAQDDIMRGFNPALIKRLLQRATINDQSGPSPFDPPSVDGETVAISKAKDSSGSTSDAMCSSAEATAAESTTTSPSKRTEVPFDEDRAPPKIPPDLFPITNLSKASHFPVPPTIPDLDPSDPNFLMTLHEKYFPNLPADPSKLAWMAPVPTEGSAADKESPYYPHPEISVSALRFDFRGRLLSPRVSRSIPTNQGLHHHGEAPEAAGYTVAELARLARSAVPAQRCLAYQTLGRILYRLGQGAWGKTEDDRIAMGVWSSMKQGRALDSLLEAASVEGGHRGSRAYALEALWLFEKGGWKEKHKAQ